MCLISTKPTRSARNAVLDPPPHRSSYSAHPHAPNVVRLPRGSTTSYHRRSSTSFAERDSYRASEPRAIAYAEGDRSRRRSVSRVREGEYGGGGGGRGSFVEERRRSVSRVRY